MQKGSNRPPTQTGMGGVIALKIYFSFMTIILLFGVVDLREIIQKDLKMFKVVFQRFTYFICCRIFLLPRFRAG